MDQKETFSLPITFINSLHYSGVQKRTDGYQAMMSEMIEYIVPNKTKYRQVTVYQAQTMQIHGLFRHYKHVTPDTKTTINNQQITNIFISTPKSFIYTFCPLFLSIECSFFVDFVKF